MLITGDHLDTELPLCGTIYQNDLREQSSIDSFKSALKESNALEKISFNLTGRAQRNTDFVY